MIATCNATQKPNGLLLFPTLLVHPSDYRTLLIIFPLTLPPSAGGSACNVIKRQEALPPRA